MRRLVIALILLAIVFSSAAAQARGKKGGEAKKPAKNAPAQTQQDVQKQQLLAALNTMRYQEMRVGVLQQLLNEELARMSSMQQAFCSQYNLDLNKFRTGGYKYDEKQGKVVEVNK